MSTQPPEMSGERGRTFALLIAISVLGMPVRAVSQETAPRAAIPLDAIETILEGFKTHPIIALGEGPHGNEQGHTFRLSLIRDPRFAMVVNDIVVEFGSAFYQATMDRFVNGEDIPQDTLQHVWQDTTATTSAWDRPIYEEFFRAVRAVNAGLPPQRRVRVLLGDAPIDWSHVKTQADLHRWGLQKGPHGADVVLKEVLAKGRRALMIYGDGHFPGRGTTEAVMINRIERAPHGSRAFIIATPFQDLTQIQSDVSSWKVPSIAMLKGTVIGARPFGSFYQPPPAPGWDKLRMEDEFDALLYLGPPGSMTKSRFPAALCRDEKYMRMRMSRLAFTIEVARKAMTDAFVQGCASLTAQ
jgi:hypothetical protein